MAERRRRPGRVGRAGLGVLVALLAVAGCTGVPSSSAPQTVQPIGVGEAPPPVPRLGAGPREIVDAFLDANATDPVKHSSAREFLTSAARNRWSDLTATVVADRRTGTYDARHRTVTVTGRKVGTLDNRGVYTPTLNGVGHGGPVTQFVFGIATVRGQHRINVVSNGLLLTEAQFRSSYQQRVLYFYDSAERYLVPDVRYSALNDAVELSDWLLGQLVSGPSTALQSVVSTDTLPAQAHRVSAKINSSLTTVQIPGSRQLSPDVRNRLAAQVGVTLTRAVHIGDITIDDGDAPVDIPRAGGTRFAEADFTDAEGPPAPAQDVYYLDLAGHIRRENGAVLKGPLSSSRYVFDSIALAQPAAIGALTVAAVQGTGDQQRLLVGTQGDGLRPTTVFGRLTRPAWVPGRAEVWIGQGAKVVRVTTTGRTSTASAVSIPSAAGGGAGGGAAAQPRRLAGRARHRGGERPAPALRRPGGAQRADRPGQRPAAGEPDGVVIEDVAWVDSLKLYTIGYIRSSLDAGVFQCGIDGSQWEDLGISTLPKARTSITATTDAPAWVSADGFVWEQNGSNWVSPGTEPNGQTPGVKPVYLG